MRKAFILVFVVLLSILVVFIVIGDFQSERPGKRPGNIYELDVDQYQGVDPSLVSHRETKNYSLDARTVNGLAYRDGKLYLAASCFFQVFDLEGRQLLRVNLIDTAFCLAVTGVGQIVTGFRNCLGMYSPEGEMVWTADPIGERCVITDLAVKDNTIFVADAGNRCIHRFSTEGSYLGQFLGKSGGPDLHGFIVPSPYFDIDINEAGELWVVNPGKRALENYSDEGALRGYWENTSVKIEGFSGCCNPAHFAFLPDGSFITSEKGLVRIKIHKPSGEFASVVAPPELFREDGKAPDVVSDEEGNIYALDYDRKMIRLFRPME